ncbi:MAG: response regulator transcription factor [Planctomycetes bacterium]|nr:response regulator transcription factor [Planctomycetota bacterium]MBI3833476.1 response regulator transcription factor [Planctomycetota bacterium]
MKEHEKNSRRSLLELFTTAEWKALAVSLAMTHRQTAVARLICLGHSNPEIAKSIGASLPTVRMHVQALLRRLRIGKRIGVPVVLVVCDRILHSHK